MLAPTSFFFLNGICPIIDFLCVYFDNSIDLHRHRPFVFQLGDAIHFLFELSKSTSITLRSPKLV